MNAFDHVFFIAAAGVLTVHDIALYIKYKRLCGKDSSVARLGFYRWCLQFECGR